MATAQFNPTKDSMMSGISVTVNFGANTKLWDEVTIDGGAKVQLLRAILAFDVSALAGATINSASLIREITTELDGGDAFLRRVTRTDWVEAEVTWNKYKASTNWTAGGGDVSTTDPTQISYTEPSATGAHTLTGLGPFVTKALDTEGGVCTFLLRMQDESAGGVSRGVEFYSKEGTTDPVLEVDYTPVANPDVAIPNPAAFGSANVLVF